ncbi:MAG TPA: hypothetical protein VMH31_07660 [Methylomirabilota bacterium]|nr:hypothetical protein [Methylomirabilota bacterium]
MVFGHNSNLKLGNITFHVQTEDRGEAHALLDTTVYYHGRVLHRRTNNYFDLLPLNEDRQQALKLRLEEQHRTVMDEIRSGTLQLAIPPDPAPQPATPAHSHTPAPSPLHLELVNAKNWLVGKHAKLHARAKHADGTAVAGAPVTATLEGAADEHVFHGLTDEQGDAIIEFNLPRITGAEPALVLRVERNGAEGHLRFALKAKPRVPSV